MKSYVRHGTLMLALIGGLGIASAQVGSDVPAIQHAPSDKGGVNVQLKLTDTQRRAIADAVRKDNKTLLAPPSFVVSVGAPVPPAIELYILPDSALAQVPDAKAVKYTVVQNQLVLVDPTTMRVVDIIPK